MQPLTITRGTFTAHLYDVGGFMELPLANTRKLWKLMLEDTYKNEDAINTVREWLPGNVKNMNAAAQSALDHCKQARKDADTAHSTVAAFGSMVTKEQQAALRAANARHKQAQRDVKTANARLTKAKKLQTIFNEMAANAKL
ncbi:hypothetical protein LJC34_02620 [Oscillospiraceae bacterium OttesenSCG-928-G22]|nr:hypothetical protein [Oscillospiraceae bacterium OttesenSCG-928-G22]